MTVFSKALPIDVAVRLWDVFVCSSDAYLLRVSIGIPFFGFR